MKISRRKFFAGAGAAASGFAAASASPIAAQTAEAKRAGLPDVWGQDFLYQWTPPQNVKRDLTPGPNTIRLSNSQDITNKEGTDYAQLFQTMRDGGWTACEAPSSQWLSRKIPESEVQEIKTQLKAHDVVFYGIHCAGNIIAPEGEGEQWQKHIIEAIHSAEEFGCQFVLTHVGSMYPQRDTAHPLNWSREAWEKSVKGLQNILKATAGSKIEVAIEPVNTESINNPWAFKRLKEDVGDPRLMCGLDITNCVFAGTAFRMTELLNTAFDLLEGDIAYVHAKDFVWNGMLPGLNWALQGTGLMDYETFLVRVSRIKNPKMYVEFLRTPEEYQEAQRNIRTIAANVGVKIYGEQKA
jgi:sugar phosphate isomerase/epimerase